MKTLILSTIAAAAIALSAGTALASENSPDNGFAIYLESVLESVTKAPAPARQFLSNDAGYDQGDYTGAGYGSPGHRDSSH